MNQFFSDNRFRKLCELVVASTLIMLLNLLSPQDPGFLFAPVNPYLFFAIFITIFYSKYYGIASVFISVLLVFALFPTLSMLVTGTDPGDTRSILSEYLPPKGGVEFGTGLAVVFIIGLARDYLAGQLEAERKRADELDREKDRLSREVSALMRVNRELDRRVSRTTDSIIVLRNQILKLYSLNLGKVLETVIDIVDRFTGAESCTIRQYIPEEKELVLRSRGGSGGDPGPHRLSAEGTIEGWVVRNNRLFSIRMLLDYENLKKMYDGRAIYCVPVHAGPDVWGVLTIDSLPFERFNQYTENMLLLILSLAAPALQHAAEFESLQVSEALDPVSGLPGYAGFWAMLETELERAGRKDGTLSVVILEVANYLQLVEIGGRDGVHEWYGDFTASIRPALLPEAQFFLYKDHSQIGIICPHLDRDGASLFCLNILETVNSRPWKIRGTEIRPEIILGFNSLANTGDPPGAKDFLMEAEHLLELLKV